MINGDTFTAPVVNIMVDTPYFTGRFNALSVEKPVYDIVVENIPGARNANDPDRNWRSNLELKEKVRKTAEGKMLHERSEMEQDRSEMGQERSEMEQERSEMEQERSEMEQERGEMERWRAVEEEEFHRELERQRRIYLEQPALESETRFERRIADDIKTEVTYHNTGLKTDYNT